MSITLKWKIGSYFTDYFSNYSWNYVASMQKARGGLCVTSYAGKLWAIGGEAPGDEELSSIEVYDPQVDAWFDSQVPMKSIKGMATCCLYTSKYFNRI